MHVMWHQVKWKEARHSRLLRRVDTGVEIGVGIEIGVATGIELEGRGKG